MLAFSVACSAGISLLLVGSSWLFPMLYNTGNAVRALATFMIIITALATPFRAFAHAAYFTLRSGGKVMVTILFDSVYMWCVVMPVSLALAYLTGIGIHWMFVICQGVEAIKFILGALLLRRGTWARQLVADESLKV
jgi:Na+-driven multidrug efflux pump